MRWRFSAEGNPIIVSPGKLSSVPVLPSLSGEVEVELEGENGCGWSEDMLEGMKRRVVFERPERADS